MGLKKHFNFQKILIIFQKLMIKKSIAMKIYVKVLSLLPGIFGRSAISSKPMHIHMSVSVLLLHFK